MRIVGIFKDFFCATSSRSGAVGRSLPHVTSLRSDDVGFPMFDLFEVTRLSLYSVPQN